MITMLKQLRSIHLWAIYLLIFAITLPIVWKPAYANVPMLEQIRVALYIDTRTTVPSVTLSSPNGLQIGIREPSGIRPWITHPSAEPIRGSVDQYMVLLLETPDALLANQVASQLNRTVGETYIMSQMKSGRTVYRVYTGTFSSEAQARSAMEVIQQQATHPNVKAQVTGPFYLSAGTFQSEQDAMDRMNMLLHYGLSAYLVYHENGDGQIVYSVWLGEAANAQQLETIRNQALTVIPDLHLQPVQSDAPYLLKRNQVMPSKQEVPHYYYNAKGQNVWIAPINGLIQVNEKNRTYRGTMELTTFANRLALINELPFEHYLYSVVSSELSSSWPMEALKAQAVAARTYALKLGMKYQIAHVSDTTYEQAYHGASVEFPAAIAAVDATAGEVIVNRYGLIEAFYYSNAGGMTADASEIWGRSLDYIRSVPSPDDMPQKGKLMWNRVVLPNGQIGYIRSDYTKETGEKNPAGFPYLVTDGNGVNVRPAPYVDNTNNKPIAQTHTGDRLILIDQMIESNVFSWVRGPYTADQMKQVIERTSRHQINGPLKTLEVSKRGPSGRVIEMKANGQVIPVSTPDSYRTVMNGLLSTRFDVEQTGKFTILGANGERHFPEQSGQLYVLSGNSSPSQPAILSADEYIVINQDHEARVITKDAKFRFIGLGYGHGIGMSQWGARELAEFVGYDYQQILKYYYYDVSIVRVE